MNAKRFYIVMVAVFVLIIGSGVGLTVYANTWLTEKSKHLTSTKLETLALEEKQRVNQKAQDDLLANQATISTLEKITPKSKDQAKTIAELLQIANDTGLSINSITFPSSELGAVVKPATPATGTGSSATTPAPKATTPAVTQTKPVEGISGILGIEVSIAQIDRKGGIGGSGMTYTQLLDFLRAIERNRRTMQVKILQIQPLQASTGSGVGGYALTMTLNIFVKP